MSETSINSRDIAASGAVAGAFSPLRHRLFAVLWVATILGNVGTFMRDVVSAWLVTDLSGSPGSVALMQAAAALPIFLLAIPAGALADIVDRRKFLIAVQLGIAAISTALCVLAAMDHVTVLNLILMTFLGGVGAALLGPAWQSIVPQLVPKTDLKSAVALGALGFNISRAIGPAIGGLLLAAAGAATTYGIVAITYLAVIAALVWWRNEPPEEAQLTEQFTGAVRAGFRYALASMELRRVLWRTVVFFLVASVVWALLPIVARDMLKGDARFYGMMLGSIGGGAILGAVLMPHVRKAFDADRLMLAASMVIALVLACLAWAPPQWLALAVSLVFGIAWIFVLTTLNAVTQGILPNWVRGRGLAIYLMAFNGAMTAGSLAWGAIGEAIGIRFTLLSAAAVLALIAVLTLRFKLPLGDADLTPSHHWPEPVVAGEVEEDRGPVLITIEYRIELKERQAFLEALGRLSYERRRDGAYLWGVSEDAAAPEVILEWFFVESWVEHLRQHRRVSRADADIQEDVRRFHTSGEPVVRHYLALSPDAFRTKEG